MNYFFVFFFIFVERFDGLSKRLWLIRSPEGVSLGLCFKMAARKTKKCLQTRLIPFIDRHKLFLLLYNAGALYLLRDEPSSPEFSCWTGSLFIHSL